MNGRAFKAFYVIKISISMNNYDSMNIKCRDNRDINRMDSIAMSNDIKDGLNMELLSWEVKIWKSIFHRKLKSSDNQIFMKLFAPLKGWNQGGI